MANVRFGVAASKVAAMDYTEDSGISTEDWAEMSEEERETALDDWLGEQVGAWVEVPGE